MTVVRVRALAPVQPGLVAAQGAMIWQPTTRHTAGDAVVVPAPFTVPLENGSADVTVEPTTLAWVWYVTESFYGAPDVRRAFVVPDAAEVDYVDLIEVDPASLDPVAAPEPAWYAYVDALQAQAVALAASAAESEAAAQGALQAAVGSQAGAAASAAAAADSETAAAGSQAAAVGSAAAAAGSASDAANSAGQAATARDAAASAQASAAGYASAASGSAEAAESSATAAAGSATAAAEEADLAVAAKADTVAAANGFTIGTVTTTAPGGAAAATITGVAPDRKLNLDLPQGLRGPALEASVIGTVTGPETPGTPGLQGQKGDKGDPGGFTAATDLGVLDLNGIITAGLYRQTQGANCTTARNYPVTVNATAVLVVYMVSTTNVIQQFEFTIGTLARRVQWHRSSSDGGATWTTWDAFSRQRTDQTAGRAVYTFDEVNFRDQLIHADTGSREISAYLDTSKWVAGNIKIRRVGYEVELRAYGLDNVAGLLGSVGILNAGLPAGFRNQHTVAGFAQIGANSGQVITAFGATQVTIVGVVDGAICGFTARWQTTDPWPTVLPGNADGAIPNL